MYSTILKLKILNPTFFKNFIERTRPTDTIQIYYDYPHRIVLTTLNTDRLLSIGVEYLVTKDEIETTRTVAGLFNISYVNTDLPLILFIAVKGDERPEDISLLHYQKLSDDYTDEFIESDLLRKKYTVAKL